jgi:hypothetical protein
MNSFMRAALLTLPLLCVTAPPTAKTMIDYFKPIPIVGQLSTTRLGRVGRGCS